MGDVTLNHFFERIDFGVPDFSPHGTRGTAATLLREHGFGRDVVELLLDAAYRCANPIVCHAASPKEVAVAYADASKPPKRVQYPACGGIAGPSGVSSTAATCASASACSLV